MSCRMHKMLNSHPRGVINGTCDALVVIYGGKIQSNFA
jgi:hypothetical protein